LYVDSHCHLNFDMFESDLPQVMARARQAGVERMLNPGIDLASSQAAIRLAELYPEIYAAVGLHPNDATAWTEGTLEALQALAQHPKVAAIGEIGIDYYRERAPHDLQQRVFQAQLELAGRLGLPVVIHTRDKSPTDRRATADALDLLADWQQALQRAGSPLAERPGVLHSFGSGLAEARRALKLNFKLGITGPVTFRSAAALQQLVIDLGSKDLLIETDAPFLTPQPFRGERNEPAHVFHVADKIAQLLGLPIEQIANTTTANAERLFRWQAIR
jgi:TatD DNase family protein